MWPYDDPLNPWPSPIQAIRPAAPKIQPLAPQEEDSLLGKISGAALGGLGYVGSVLEKTLGGRAIRGALGGKPRELLSILPFSDTLGITDEADRVSGRELLRNAGLADHEDNWGNFLGGMGLELATDPGMYLSFGAGAASRAGQVAKKIGAMPPTATGRVTGTLADILAAQPALQGAAETAAGGGAKLASMLSEPLGGLAGIGLPFQHPSFLLGAGQGGADFLSGAGRVASTLDAGLRKIPLAGHLYGSTVDTIGRGLDIAGRYANAWFDPAALGATTRMGQETAREASGQIRPLIAEARSRAAQYGETLKQAGLDPTGEILRSVAEGTYKGQAHPLIEQTAMALRSDMDTTLAKLQSLGVDVNALEDSIHYLPRAQTPLTRPTSGYGSPRQALPTRDPRVAGREDILKNFSGGTQGINEMILDPAVYQGTPLSAQAHIRGRYLDPALAQPDAIKQSESLANWVRSLDPQYQASIGTANPLKFFSNHPLTDYTNYYDRISRLMASGDATQNLLAKSAAQTAGQLPAGAMSLPDALSRAGLTHAPGGEATLLDRINTLRGGAGQSPLASVDELKNLHVPGEVISEATRYLKPFQTPEAVSTPLSWIDTITNFTKALQTAPWPAFHVRNLASGLWQNAAKEMGAGEAGGFFKQLGDAYRLGKGEIIADANMVKGLEHLSPEQATRALGQEMYAWGIGGHMPHIGRDVVGPGGNLVNAGTTLDTFLARIPGYAPQGVKSAVGKLSSMEPGAWNPLNVQGVGANADIFSPVAAGRAMGDVVEGTNRGSLYFSLRRQGWTPEAAAREVVGSHFDYTRMGRTEVERNLLSRLIPFYTFARNNLPLQVSQMAQHPGGMAGTLARVAGDLRQQAGFLPDYLGSGLAVPVGEEDNGLKRYLTRLDLPPEQAFELLHGGPKGNQNSLMALLGQMNPLLKAPVEYATGKQFFTGRDLGDLYNMTGSSTLDQVLMNSPLSRIATTARTLSDPRKLSDPLAALAIPLNLATGAKLTDVDLEKQRNIAAREYVKDMLQGQPEISKFETLYLRPGMEQLLTPAEWELLRLNKTVEEKAKQAAKR